MTKNRVARGVAVFLLLGGAATAATSIFASDEGQSSAPRPESGSATVSPETPSPGAPVAPTVDQAQLQGLADNAARLLATNHESEASALISLASTATGCRMVGFTGGPELPGLRDLDDPAARAYIREDAVEGDFIVAFGRAKGHVQLVVAAACNVPASGSGV